MQPWCYWWWYATVCGWGGAFDVFTAIHGAKRISSTMRVNDADRVDARDLADTATAGDLITRACPRPDHS